MGDISTVWVAPPAHKNRPWVCAGRLPAHENPFSPHRKILFLVVFISIFINTFFKLLNSIFHVKTSYTKIVLIYEIKFLFQICNNKNLIN